MKIRLFYHSLLSDWNHGNAHFLRGVVTELQSRGHDVRVFEPADAWSVAGLRAAGGDAALEQYRRYYPSLDPIVYAPDALDLDRALDGCDVVIVHEWSDLALVARIGAHRAHGGRYRLLFHDTHHRSVSAPAEMAQYDLRFFDGALCFGEIIRRIYL